MYPIYPLISPLYLLRVFSVATVATQRNTYAEQRVRREPSGRYAGRSRWPRWPDAGVFLPQVATVAATVRGYGGQTVASAAIVLFVGFILYNSIIEASVRGHVMYVVYVCM